MTKEDYEKKFLKKYGCKTLYEFIDVYLDFDLAIELLTDYFLKCSYVINLEKNILERNKNDKQKI